jgi:hypothetical protein
VLLLVAACTFGLAACKSNVGVAARIDGRKISEADVHGMISSKGPSQQALAQAAQSGGNLSPKNIVVSILINEALFRAALNHAYLVAGADQNNPKLVTQSDLDAVHDTAPQAILGTQLAGKELDAFLIQSIENVGLKASALPHVLAFYELQYLLINEVKAQSGADVTKAIVAAHVHVTINPAYGSWDANTGRVNGSTPPNFLTRLPDYVVPTAPVPSTSAAN